MSDVSQPHPDPLFRFVRSLSCDEIFVLLLIFTFPFLNRFWNTILSTTPSHDALFPTILSLNFYHVILYFNADDCGTVELRESTERPFDVSKLFISTFPPRPRF